MTTAMLRVLDEYTVDENDFDRFQDDLSLWASKWVPEIGVGIAKSARELFVNQAIRMLVEKWAEMERKDTESYKVAFEHAVDGDDVDADDFKGVGTYDKAGISAALYLLLIQ